MSGMNAKTGRKLNGPAHIQQSIDTILSTPLGSVTMLREFGSMLPELIDQPLHGATLLRAYAASADALMRWENRVAFDAVRLVELSQGYLELQLDTIEADGRRGALAVPLSLRGSA